MNRMKTLRWTMPLQIIAMFGALSIILQSCSIPIEQTATGRYINIENLYTPFVACGVMLIIGTAFSIFNFIQLGKISRILKTQGYSI